MADYDLKQVQCTPECGFEVKSHDEEELAEITKEHTRKKHQTEVSHEDAKGMIKPA